MSKITNKLLKAFSLIQHKNDFDNLDKNVLEVEDYSMLQKALNWQLKPNLNFEDLNSFNYYEDLNNRRLRDAEVLLGTCINKNPCTILEIGTSTGRTTYMIAKNAPSSTIFTINIPPEEIKDGGHHITHGISKDEIGKEFKNEPSINNVTQIYANTLNWEPEMEVIDIAFIDGSHDANFVYNDTVKILSRCKKGSFILWHDFNPRLRNVYPWIREVSSGIENLYRNGFLKGRVLHLKNSWIGLYIVP